MSVAGSRLGAHRRGEQSHEDERAKHVATVALLALVGLAGCQHDTSAIDGAFYNWDGRKVHCAIDLDTYARNDLASVEAGLDRVAERGEVLELYAHDPGRTVEWSDLEAVLAATRRPRPAVLHVRRLRPRRAARPRRRAVVRRRVHRRLARRQRPLHAVRRAPDVLHRATTTSSDPSSRPRCTSSQREGHAIEAHSVAHLRAPLYAEQKGVGAYIADEALPSITRLRDDGFEVTTYAYPYGARTERDRRRRARPRLAGPLGRVHVVGRRRSVSAVAETQNAPRRRGAPSS